MTEFQAALVFGVLVVVCPLFLLARLSGEGFSSLAMRLKSCLGEFELLASKNQADLIAAQNRLGCADESKRSEIEN